MESQPKNPEFMNNPENYHPSMQDSTRACNSLYVLNQQNLDQRFWPVKVVIIPRYCGKAYFTWAFKNIIKTIKMNIIWQTARCLYT